MALLKERAVSYQCAECGFTLWHPFARLASSTLGLYDDARFPGRCLLAFDGHVDDFAALDERQSIAFVRDAQHVARALKRATRAHRVNYAILGNVERHLHFHLIPRVLDGDPVPNKSPWSHPEPARPLPVDERERLIARIASELAK